MEIKISRPFQNPNDIENPESYNLVCKVYGLKSQYFAERDGSCLIDYSIIDIIVILSRMGYITFACCSGLESDHSHIPLSGYISFRGVIKDRQWKIVEKLARGAGFEIEDDKVIRIQGSDEQRRKVWAKFKKLIELNL